MQKIKRLTDLIFTAERLISPPIPYMRLHREGSYGIMYEIINVKQITTLFDDYSFNSNFERTIIHKSSYVSGFVKKSTGLAIVLNKTTTI